MPDLPDLSQYTDTGKQALRDQFLAHVRNIYETQTGQPFGNRAKQACFALATIVGATGEGAYRDEGPMKAAQSMLGMCEIVVKEFGPDD